MQDYVYFVADCINNIFGSHIGQLSIELISQVILCSSVVLLIIFPFLVFRNIVLMVGGK